MEENPLKLHDEEDDFERNIDDLGLDEFDDFEDWDY